MITRPTAIHKILAGVLLVLTCACCMPDGSQADETGENTHPATASDAPEITPIGLFRRFISKADGDRCPMYPTCSHYASEAFAKKGILIGWILTSDRLLRCGRDETRLAPKIRIHGRVHSYDPVSANTFWWDTP